MIKCETRGSKVRYQFQLTISGTTQINDIKLTLVDSNSFLRHEINQFMPSLSPGSNVVVSMMTECMKPSFPSPTMKISYTESNLGVRNNEIPVPILTSSFNEPLNFPANVFAEKWTQLSQFQVQEVVKCSNGVIPANITKAFMQIMKFGRISGLPDESDTIVYGAATLRTGTLVAGGGPNDKVSIGCLAKVEMNVQSGQVRITIRATHGVASNVLLETAKSLLE